MMRFIAVLASAALVASNALAQAPPGNPAAGASEAAAAQAQLSGALDFRATFTIWNGTDYSLFTETLGAGLECIRNPIPATSIAPWSHMTFVMEAVETGSCGSKPSVGQQTFVIGAPGPEQRITAGFKLSRHSAGDNGAGGGRAAQFILNPASVTTTTSNYVPMLTGVYLDWRLGCTPDC